MSGKRKTVVETKPSQMVKRSRVAKIREAPDSGYLGANLKQPKRDRDTGELIKFEKLPAKKTRKAYVKELPPTPEMPPSPVPPVERHAANQSPLAIHFTNESNQVTSMADAVSLANTRRKSAATAAKVLGMNDLNIPPVASTSSFEPVAVRQETNKGPASPRRKQHHKKKSALRIAHDQDKLQDEHEILDLWSQFYSANYACLYIAGPIFLVSLLILLTRSKINIHTAFTSVTLAYCAMVAFVLLPYFVVFVPFILTSRILSNYFVSCLKDSTADMRRDINEVSRILLLGGAIGGYFYFRDFCEFLLAFTGSVRGMFQSVARVHAHNKQQ